MLEIKLCFRGPGIEKILIFISFLLIANTTEATKSTLTDLYTTTFKEANITIQVQTTTEGYSSNASPIDEGKIS